MAGPICPDRGHLAQLAQNVNVQADGLDSGARVPDTAAQFFMNANRDKMTGQRAAQTQRIISLLFGFAAFVNVSAAAFAQETHVWSEVDCAQSKIVVPTPGFKCRATQEYYGGQGTAASGAGGMFRQWTASATLNNVRIYYLLHEATAAKSTVTTTESLEQRIKQLGQKADKNFSSTLPMAGGDYVRYEGPAGQPCIGIRKYGPSTTTGFKWIMLGTHCVQKGRTISDQDVGSFIASADYRK
jgi:hypothetical protein